MKTEIDVVNSINGRKILYKKNYIETMSNGHTNVDIDKLQNNMVSDQIYSAHFDKINIYSRKKLDPINIKII